MPKPETKQEPGPKTKKPASVKRVSSAGLRVDSVLQTETGNLKEFFSLGRKLGQSQFETTFLCVKKATDEEYACKSIDTLKLSTHKMARKNVKELQYYQQD